MISGSIIGGGCLRFGLLQRIVQMDLRRFVAEQSLTSVAKDCVLSRCPLLGVADIDRH
jgi:hypothetical protein